MFTQNVTITAPSQEVLDGVVAELQHRAYNDGATITLGASTQLIPFNQTAIDEAGVGAHGRAEQRYERGAVKRQAADKLRGQIKQGDTVRMVEPLRPKYLVGKLATVIKINDATVTIKTGKDCGRFSEQEVRCPANCIEPV